MIEGRAVSFREVQTLYGVRKDLTSTPNALSDFVVPYHLFVSLIFFIQFNLKFAFVVDF